MLDQPVAPLHGLAALHGLPVPEHRARGQVAVAVGVLLEQLRRERVSEIRENGPTRSGVDHKVAPLLGGNIGEAPLHQRLAGGDELHHGRVAGLQVALDALDQRRRLHGGQQVVVEPLLRALECGPRGRLGLGVERARSAPARRAGDVRRLQCRIQVVVDDLEGAGIGIVDAALPGRQRVLDELVLDALIGERPSRVEAEALEVARQHLHRGHAAGLDGLHELGPRGEGEIRPAPQAQTLGIGEVVHRRGAGRRDVDDARIGERVLQAQSRTALLRRHLLAAFGLAAGRVLHGVALVEHDHAVEAGRGLGAGLAAEPGEDLIEARSLALALGRAQRCVGDEQDTLGEPDRCPLAEACQRLDEEALLAQGGPVAPRVLDQRLGLGDPQGLAPALEPVVENDAGHLAALAAAGAVAEEPAAPEAHGVGCAIGCRGNDIEGGIDGPATSQMGSMRLARVDHALQLRVREEPLRQHACRKVRPVRRLGRCHRGHRRRLHEPRRMAVRAGDADRLQGIVLVERPR